jgi:hypothetical protein
LVDACGFDAGGFDAGGFEGSESLPSQPGKRPPERDDCSSPQTFNSFKSFNEFIPFYFGKQP